jgi:hypothetical protein
MIPAIFCRPVINPKVVALPLVEIVLLDNQAGMITAGVKAPKVRRKVLCLVLNCNYYSNSVSCLQKVSKTSMMCDIDGP